MQPTNHPKFTESHDSAARSPIARILEKFYMTAPGATEQQTAVLQQILEQEMNEHSAK